METWRGTVDGRIWSDRDDKFSCLGRITTQFRKPAKQGGALKRFFNISGKQFLGSSTLSMHSSNVSTPNGNKHFEHLSLGEEVT